MNKVRVRKLFGLKAKIQSISIAGDLADVAFLESRPLMLPKHKAVLDREVQLLRLHDKNINAAKQAQLVIIGRLETLSKLVTKETECSQTSTTQ